MNKRYCTYCGKLIDEVSGTDDYDVIHWCSQQPPSFIDMGMWELESLYHLRRKKAEND